VSGVHVYESQPSSPRKKPLALTAPTEEDKDAVPLLARGSEPRITLRERVLEDDEGNPEDIRRRFFPHANPHEPSLEWITSEDDSAQNLSRFDLAGDPIPAELIAELPTHLGLHHHSGSLAGYTLEDLLLLSRSTVPAQRTVMLEVLSGVLRNLRRGETSRGSPLSGDLISKRDELRSRIVAAGVEALSGKGTTVVRAVEVVWEGIVEWDNSFLMAPQDISVELEQPPPDGSIRSTLGPPRVPEVKDPISALPLLQILPFIAEEFSIPILPALALCRLLQVLHRLTCHSCVFASKVLATPNLLASTISCFVTAPPEPEPPNPLAIELLNIIAQSSREAAISIIDTGLADKLLRFIAILPEVHQPASSVNPNLTSPPIITHTLRLYRTLGIYGLSTHVAPAASQPFTSLARLVMNLARRIEDVPEDEAICVGLCKAWLELLEVWMICAQDPHRTTPPHDIRWSQVVAWSWSQDLIAFCDIWRRMPTRVSTYLAAALWNAIAAWVEGSSVNGLRGGEEERKQMIEVLAVGFSSGMEKRIVEVALDDMTVTDISTLSQDEARLSVAGIVQSASVLGAGVRLVTALLSSSTTNGLGTPPPAPFSFPLHQIHRSCMCLVQPKVWTQLCNMHGSYAALRPITSLYGRHLRLLHTLKLATSQEWVRDALVGLLRLIPGDEDYGVWAVSEVCALIDQDYVASLLSGWSIPSDVWSHGGISPISPLLSSAIQPQAWPDENEDDLKLVVYLAPYTASPHSIARSTRITYPSTGAMTSKRRSFVLPLAPDWPFTPIDELLRSGTSRAFRRPGEYASIPGSTEAPELSELDVVRATLVFAGAFGRAIGTLEMFSHAHVLFAGMKLIMLEQGSRDDDSSTEVFRDAFIANSLLALLTEARQGSQLNDTIERNDVTEPLPLSLEMVSTQFRGTATPFYQFYTDFVGLYDAISFSDPLFASLLLPPLAMNYPADYRKLLWIDYNHVLRTIRTDTSHPAILDLTIFLWPVEKDMQLVDAYISALCQRLGSLHGLLRDIAVHHVAYHTWPDLRVSHDATYIPLLESTETGDSPAAHADTTMWAKRLFLLATASNDVVKDVILYNHRPGSASQTEELSSELRAERMERVALYGGKELEDHLYTLLKA
jgi:hypothetical protein